MSAGVMASGVLAPTQHAYVTDTLARAGLLAYYRMEDAISNFSPLTNVMADSSTNARHGTHLTANDGNKILGQQTSLLGTDSLGYSMKYSGAGGFGNNKSDVAYASWVNTIVGWDMLIKPSAVSALMSPLDRDDEGSSRIYQFRIESNGQLNFFWWKLVSGSDGVASVAAAIAAGNIYHIGAMLNGGTMRLFINGMVVATSAATNMQTGTSFGFRIGGHGNAGVDAKFAGWIDEVAFYSTPISNADMWDRYLLTLPGTPSFASYNPIVAINESSHYSSYDVAGAFDKNTGTIWCCNTSTGWVWAKFQSAWACTSFWLQSTGVNNPKNWTFEGSNDGSTWTTVDTQTNQSTVLNTAGAAGVKYTFSNSTAYLYYRFNISASGDGSAPIITELSFDDLKTASSDGNFPGWDANKAIMDLNTIQGYGATGSGSPHWFMVEAWEPKTFTKYAIHTNIPAWVLEGSNDGSTWTTLDTRSGESNPYYYPLPGAPKIYSFTNSTAYRYYRIPFSGNSYQIPKIRFA